MTSCQPQTACHPWSGRWCAPFSDRLTWSVALPDAPLDACVGVDRVQPRPPGCLRRRALMSGAQTGIGQTAHLPWSREEVHRAVSLRSSLLWQLRRVSLRLLQLENKRMWRWHKVWERIFFFFSGQTCDFFSLNEGGIFVLSYAW